MNSSDFATAPSLSSQGSADPAASCTNTPHSPPVVQPRTSIPASTGSPSGSHVGIHAVQSPSSHHAQQIQALSSMLRAKTEAPRATQQQSSGSIPSPLAPRPRQRVVLQRQVTPSLEQEEINKMAAEEVQGDLSTEVFSTYAARHAVFASARPHPADIVEAASLADVSLPPPTYDMAACVLQCSQLSSLQLEGVLYACQRHLTLLPGGRRAGFFIGDGAGVGKGRQCINCFESSDHNGLTAALEYWQVHLLAFLLLEDNIAGIILDNYARGRCKHIWFSVSHDLKMDAERDLRDIGCFIKVIDGCQQLDKETKILGLPADFKEGVLFSTYATLVSTVHRGGQSRSRLQQLVSWCGGEGFDGCLVFDECHKAKNFIPGQEQRSTKVALAVCMVQKLLPRARVVYCSATGVSGVRNMAYMERLGLWGEGLAFRNFDNFLESITRRGLGAAEMLAMEMKSAGVYVSRGLSYKQAEFITQEMALSPEQVSVYDSASHVWNELCKSMVIALSRVGAPNQRVWATFWSAHQRFFKQLCMSMKVPAIVEEAKKALAQQDMAVVIGLQTTGESSLEGEVERCDGELTGFVSLCKEILQRFVRDHFPTTSTTPANQAVPIQDLWCVAAKDMLLEFITEMDLPNSPLDELVDRLGGPGCVAEMTGRKGRVVREGSKGDRVRYELRDSGGSALESLNNTERAAFMNGEKLVAIISDAASTGISLHSDLSASNQRRRLHITMELPWSADKAVQQLGRSHRANQASAPLYMLITTNVGGERRFAAAVAKRLQTLGALTKGDRRAATGVEFSEFNFDTQYGRSALRQMYNSLRTRQLVGGVSLHKVCSSSGADTNMSTEQFFTSLLHSVDVMGVMEGGGMKEGDLGDVGKFLNRLLGLKLLEQNMSDYRTPNQVCSSAISPTGLDSLWKALEGRDLVHLELQCPGSDNSMYHYMVFAYFCECLSVVISIAKKEGRFNEGVADIRAQSIQMVGLPKEVFTNYKLSHVPTIHTHVVVDRGVSWEEALQLYHQHTSDDELQASGAVQAGSSGRDVVRGTSGFYRSKREQYHRYLYLLALQKDNSTHLYNITRPNTGRSFFEETKSDLLQKYVTVSPDKAEKGWRSQYEMTKSHCIHGPSCKTSQSCLIGSRLTHVHLLSGGVLPLLSLLESTLARHAHTVPLSREARSLRVVRVRLDDGRRVIGIRYPLPLISEISSMLSLLRHSKQVDHAKVLPVVIPMAAKDLVIELQTPINKKSQARALTPPVSLKNFFVVKPKSSCRTDNELSRMEMAENKPKHRGMLAARPTTCSSFSVKTLQGKEKPNDNSNKSKHVQMKLFDSFAAVPPPTSTGCPVVIDDVESQCTSRSASVKELSPEHRKRKSQAEPGSDTPLLKMFRKAEKLSVMTCPICSLKIEALSNSAINLHIDKCLANSLSHS